MVQELLDYGRENTRTGKDLAKALNVDIRTITQQIEKERREGQPICASMKGAHAGYYLAADRTELESYCRQLYHRGGELFKTRRALLETLKIIQAKEANMNEA